MVSSSVSWIVVLGRAPTARAKAAEIPRLAAEGLGKAEIARRLGVGERSVYRMLAAPG
jgi:DNA-binding CsgD family transcriptional regulator